MKKLYLMATALLAIALQTGCTQPENTKPENSDAPPMITGASAVGYNGGIRVSWNNPEEGRFSYVKITFTDPLTDEDRTERVLYPATSWSLTGLVPADGDVSFNLITVSAAGVYADATPLTVNAAAALPQPVTGLTATPGPGKIFLSWTNPEDENIEQVEVSYTDPRTGSATIGTTIVDKLTYSVLNPLEITHEINRLELSYGEIEFTVTVVAKNGLRSEAKTARATSQESLPPPAVTDFTATPGAGMITLAWTYPLDGDIVKGVLSYTDPRDGSPTKDQTITVDFTYSTGELSKSYVVDELLAKYGEIEFTVTTVSINGKSSEPVTASATSERGTISTKLALTVDMLSSNATEPSEGSLAGLIDEDTSTYWHSQWSGSGRIPYPNYIQVILPESITQVKFKTVNRDHPNRGVKTAEILVGTDTSSLTEIGEIVEGQMVNTKLAEFMSPVYTAETPFNIFRFNVTAAIGNPSSTTESEKDGWYWALAELEVYKVEDEPELP